MAYSACNVVRMSLKSISCACSERPDVWMWYLSIWARADAPYFSRMVGPDATSHAADDCILGIDAVGKEKLRLGPNSFKSMPRLK